MYRLFQLALVAVVSLTGFTGAAADIDADTADGGPTFWDNWTFIPLAFYLPETSVGLGLAVVHTFDLPGQDAQRSSVAGGVIQTFKSQTIARIVPEFRYDNRLVAQSLFRYERFPTEYFPPGATADTVGEPYDEESFVVEPDIAYRLWRGLAAGLLYHLRYNDVLSVTDGGHLASGTVAGTRGYLATGIGPTLTWDSRDTTLAPTSGMLHRLSLLVFQPWLGGDVSGTQLRVDLRGYINVYEEHVIAIRGLFQTTGGQLPFQLRPTLGGADLLRGWFRGHLRGNHLVALQLEYRMPLVWRFGLVAFVGAGHTVDRFADFDFGDMKMSAGGGLRFSLNSAQRVNLRVDLAYGSAFQVYIDVLETF